MIYKDFQGENISVLGMGNMRLPTKGEGGPIDREKAQAIIDYAMANGINYYDTAYPYHGGESESFLGEAMKKYPRESYKLATKYFILANPDYKAVFEEQLSKLQTDYVDFYLIHGIFDHTWQQYIDSGCIEYFIEQKKAGRIKHLGFSSHAKVEYLEKFADYTEWEFCQLQMNYFDWEYGTAKAEYEAIHSRNIPIVVMEPVRGGRLASLTPEAEAILKAQHPDWSIASWAFRWLKGLDSIQVILSGMTTMDQIVDNVKTFETEGGLSAEDETALLKAREVFRSNLQVPCTGCRYCCDDCPQSINIPAFLTIYNAFKVDGPRGTREAIDAVESTGKPTDCIGCGLCTGHCPQSIDVPSAMAELAEIMNH